MFAERRNRTASRIRDNIAQDTANALSRSNTAQYLETAVSAPPSRQCTPGPSKVRKRDLAARQRTAMRWWCCCGCCCCSCCCCGRIQARKKRMSPRGRPGSCHMSPTALRSWSTSQRYDRPCECHRGWHSRQLLTFVEDSSDNHFLCISSLNSQ